MACDLTKGRSRPCKDALGGNSKLYLFNYIENPFTVADGEATAMNVGLTQAFEYDLYGDGNTLEESMVGDRNTGSRVNTQTLTIVVTVPDASTNAEFNLLVASYSQAVVVDRNGNHRAIGIDDGIDWTVVESTGGAKTDGTTYTITGVSETRELAPFLDDATVTAFEAIVS